MSIPAHIWGHALRMWLAAVTAHYVAFWLQLGGASSAAVTVAILAQPTRGAVLAKAINRIAATFIGATTSVVIAGLFPGERMGLLAAFILWICVCVFVGSYFRGFRAYAAVLSGYTVAIITVANIDTPQSVFTAMTDRVAAITIGILSLTIINDLFSSPPVWRGVDRRMTQAWQDVRDYAREMLSGERDDCIRAGKLLAQVAELRADVDIVAHDMADGRHRAAGARSAMLALVEIVQQVRLSSLLERGDPLAVTIRDQCLAALDGNRSEALAFLTGLRDGELSRPDVIIAAIGQIQQALRFVEALGQLKDGLLSLREGIAPARDVRLPHRKEFFFALRNAIRIGIAVSAGALFDRCHGRLRARCGKRGYHPLLFSHRLTGLRSACHRNGAGHDLWRLAQRQSEDRWYRRDDEYFFRVFVGTVQPSILQPDHLLFGMHVRGNRPWFGLSGVPSGVAGIRT